ncbi:MAG: hypothetical protein HQK54_15535 [Oligoflexales bacterium]|nr:hypothetical protein [Oligoflexales bacterium]
MRPFAPFSQESGIALLEQIISMTILIITVTIAFRSVSDVIQMQGKQKAGDVLFENDDLIRYEITKMLRSIQRRTTEINVNQQCTQPGFSNLYHQIAAERKVTQTIFFGVPSEMRYSSDPFIQRIYKDVSNLASKAEKVYGQNPNAKLVFDAYHRCDSMQSFKVNYSLMNSNSLYMCAFGENVLVEIKSTFWDFNKNTVLTCSGMNELPGRGFQVVFRAFNFVQSSSPRDSLPYSIKMNDGRLYVTKEVWEMN